MVNKGLSESEIGFSRTFHFTRLHSGEQWGDKKEARKESAFVGVIPNFFFLKSLLMDTYMVGR